jgi:hypothetical protein
MSTLNLATYDPSDQLADPLADDTIAAIIGPWPSPQASLDAAALQRLSQVSHLMSSWGSNASLATWQPPAGTDPQIGSALVSYLRQGSQLPEWADRAQVERSEALFLQDGPLSCALLFCASLPECYVLPNLADVLHIAGQLEAHTEHRIRQTAAMIFPVMLRGGLMGADGQGLAQVLKVRLIHATIRHLILHGHPKEARGIVLKIAASNQSTGMYDALMRHGWDVSQQGMPCNQTELAYTLLTFSFVFLKGLRTLGQGLSRDDEEAYLHTWNVMGHILGIRSELMARTMPQAQTMFEQMQSTARRAVPAPDVRPALGRALMNAMAQSLSVPVVRDIPVVLTQWLVGKQTSQDIGLGTPASWPTRVLFSILRVLVGTLDALGRLFSSQFSLSRLFTRVLGYHLVTKLLLSQTRPLALPDRVLDDLHQTVSQWGNDSKAGSLLNRLEDQLTTPGPWRPRPARTPKNSSH